MLGTVAVSESRLLGSAYLDAGGWPPRSVDEDVALVKSLARRRVIRTQHIL